MTWTVLITLASAAAAVTAGARVMVLLASRDRKRALVVMVRATTYRNKYGQPVTRRAHYRRMHHRPWWMRAASPQRLTRLAMLIAGRQRASVCGEWRSHLAGETGTGLPEGRQAREAAGFVVAAMRYRLDDLAGLLWRPVDAVLASRALSSLVVLLPALCVSVLFTRAGGLLGLAEHLEDVAVAWGATFGLIRAGRNWRDVKPPERRTRRKEQ
jgi:hypothetical protein